jgi:SAM-dependent methyltransferase
MLINTKDNLSTQSDWFEQWFNSPYYYVLYKERDSAEAHSFLDALIEFLKPAPGASILDVACGKGRHSVYLNKLGYDVTGFDLSHESIAYDKQFENERLSFYIHDMREISWVNCFDYVFNLFTSFGYFDREHDNVKTIKANSAALKQGGILVLDFMNAEKVIKHLPFNETKTINGISFNIKKYIEDDYIVKEITFTDKGKRFHFYERLQIFHLSDFEKYFEDCHLSIQHVFGDYKLSDFNLQQSDRLILIAKKEKQQRPAPSGFRVRYKV